MDYGDGYYDELAVKIVCHEGRPMKLRGADRVEALRRLSAAGKTIDEILHLLMMDPTQYYTIRRLRRRHGIPAPPAATDPYSRSKILT